MLRRNARLRNEYLYRKSLEGKERDLYEKKRKIRVALQEGKAIPTELRREEASLREQVELEDDNTAVPRSHVDDEYALAATREPHVLITTSRDPSSRLVAFAKELKLIFPGSARVNRGSSVVSELVDSCRSHGFTDLVLVHEHRGEPDGLVISHMPYGPTAFFGLSGAVLRHDIGDKGEVGTVPGVAPHLVLEGLTSRLGERLKTVLKHLFPAPKADSRRVVTFCNRSDVISFRHHVYERKGKDVELRELGPRFEAKLFQITLGTVDQKHAEKEWALRSFTRSAKKQRLRAPEETDE